jgi:hypothetical protein
MEIETRSFHSVMLYYIYIYIRSQLGSEGGLLGSRGRPAPCRLPRGRGRRLGLPPWSLGGAAPMPRAHGMGAHARQPPDPPDAYPLPWAHTRCPVVGESTRAAIGESPIMTPTRCRGRAPMRAPMAAGACAAPTATRRPARWGLRNVGRWRRLEPMQPRSRSGRSLTTARRDSEDDGAARAWAGAPPPSRRRPDPGP